MTSSDALTQQAEIARELLRDIQAWRYPPGGWIREREVAERFGVSHVPAREALRSVAQAGLVEIVPWRGARVIPLDRHDVYELMELFRVLFGTCCKLAATNLSAEDIAAFQGRVAEYASVVGETRDPQRQGRLGFGAGEFIRRRCGATAAADLLLHVSRIVRWQHRSLEAVHFELQSALPGERALAGYYELVAALRARDPNAAEAAAHRVAGATQEPLIASVRQAIARQSDSFARFPRRGLAGG